MKADSIIEAKKEAISYLDKYRKSKNFSDLENAMHFDNTNQDIIFQYLSHLKSNNLEKYDIEKEKYKFFLEEKFCAELKIKYIDHKKDLLSLIDSIRMVDSKNLLDFQPVKNALEKCYSRNDKQLLGSKSNKRINNLPLFDILNDVFLYLTLKIEFGNLLYLLVDFKFDDKDDKNNGDEDDNKYDKKSNNNEYIHNIVNKENQNLINKDKENQNVLTENKVNMNILNEEKDKNSINRDNENELNKNKDNIIKEHKDNQISVNEGKDNEAMNIVNKTNENINNTKENNENEELEDEENEDSKIIDLESQKICLSNLASFLKIYSEIIKYYLEKNEKILVFNLVNTFDQEKFYDYDTDSLKRVKYYVKEIKFLESNLESAAGVLYKNLIEVNGQSKIESFMEKYKNLFYDVLGGILKSNCVKQLVQKLSKHHKDTNNIIRIDDKYIDYLKNNIIFFPFFTSNCYGITITLNGKIMINEDYRNAELSYQETKLYNFCVWVITGIHESIGHFLKDYFYYLTDFLISDESPTIEGKNNEITEEEGGDLVEEILFLSLSKFYIHDILYILDIKNWEQNLDDFAAYFNSKKRMKLKKGIKSLNSLNLSSECITLLSKFDIQEKSIKNFKTDKLLSFKKSYEQASIDLSKMKCLTHKKDINFRKKYSRLKNMNNN